MTDCRLAILLTPFAILAAAPASSVGPQESPVSQDASLQRAIDRGKLMYLYDQAAWVTSDDMLARVPPNRLAEVGGWIVTPSTSGLHVDYFGKDKAADLVVYAADVNGRTVSNSIVYPATSEPTLKSQAMQMARALRSARTEVARYPDWHSCARAPFNTIVLLPRSDGTVPVYFLTPQTEPDNFPFGGHYEVDVAPDDTIAHTRSFTSSCLTLAKTKGPNGAQPAALFVTHMLDAHPTKIHVFEQYYIRLPLYVATGPNLVWLVDNGTIVVPLGSAAE